MEEEKKVSGMEGNGTRVGQHGERWSQRNERRRQSGRITHFGDDKREARRKMRMERAGEKERKDVQTERAGVEKRQLDERGTTRSN